MWIYVRREGAGRAPNESTCSSCGAEITWVVNVATGKSNPLDGHDLAWGPQQRRTYDFEGSWVEAAEVVLVGENADHASHFSTCPNADQHRRS